MSDWLKTPPQITARANAIRTMTEACLRFNCRRFLVTKGEGVRAVCDFIDAKVTLEMLDDLARQGFNV